jgi:hypothetical protein
MKIEVACGHCYKVNEVEVGQKNPTCSCGTPISNWRIATVVKAKEKRE